MWKKELEELIWDTIQVFIQNNPSIRNEDQLEDLLSGVEKQIALEILTKLTSGSNVADFITTEMKGQENGR